MEILRQEQSDKSGTQVVMPSVPNDNENIPGLRRQQSFEKAIMNSEVPKVLVAGGAQMEYPNYLLDFTNVEETSIYQQQAIRNLLDENGKTPIYILMKGRAYKVGYGDSDRIDEIIDLYKTYIADDKCKVYKYMSESDMREVKERDLAKIRLTL